MKNRLYYGDNLEILRNREYFPDECVDLIYLDPPFNSNRNYNVLFKSESGADSEAQITAFEDTWHWGETAEATYDDLVVNAPHKVSTAIKALMDLIERNQMLAYLVMMTARLVELHRVLKRTGSLYLHCDPTASHYLKIVLDTIFGVQSFRNEIVWKRVVTAKGYPTKVLPRNHDVIFRFTKGEIFTWNTSEITVPYDMDNLDSKTLRQYSRTDSDGRRYRYTETVAPGPRTGDSGRPIQFRGQTIQPSANSHWRIPGGRICGETIQEGFERLDKAGLLYQAREGGLPRFKRYLDEQRGRMLDDVWIDIANLTGTAKERLGYPTQKPVALLERIIRASSNEGDIVLDPFCGCGTAIAAAHKLNRRWIGIDITHLSIALQKYRLQDMFELVSGTDYEVIGEPATADAARELARDSDNEGRFQFEWWALSLVRAKPVGGSAGSRRGKKGADQGIDGIINFFDEDDKGKKKPQTVVVQVKSGKVKSGDIRDLKGTVEREGAAIGVFITLENPTQAMIKEALSAGTYESPRWGRAFRRVQILTIGDLFSGAGVDMPPQYGSHQQAERYKPTGVSVDGESQRDLI